MAKKSTYQLKQLLPEEKPETGTKYIVRKPTKGLKVSDKLRQKKYDPVLKCAWGPGREHIKVSRRCTSGSVLTNQRPVFRSRDMY